MITKETRDRNKVSKCIFCHRLIQYTFYILLHSDNINNHLYRFISFIVFTFIRSNFSCNLEWLATYQSFWALLLFYKANNMNIFKYSMMWYFNYPHIQKNDDKKHFVETILLIHFKSTDKSKSDVQYNSFINNQFILNNH